MYVCGYKYKSLCASVRVTEFTCVCVCVSGLSVGKSVGQLLGDGGRRRRRVLG